ncbi:MAG TPA: fumarate/nitrate reduction transcriptional regulator Fnr [Gammaproteobacteria bacterium]
MDPVKVLCSDCRLRNLCLPVGLAGKELKQLEEIIKQPRPLQKGQRLYLPGDKFHYLFIVRSGTLKTYTTTSSGQQQIIGFHLPGELVGLDGVSDGAYSSTAETMEMTSVCELPFTKLENVMGQVKILQHQVHRLMSKELLTDQQLLLQMGKMNAEQRVAAFLLNIACRFHQRGFSASEFHLPMTRSDIGNYLGLAVETVSRQFSHFQELNVVKVSRKHIIIQNPEFLRLITNFDIKHQHGKEATHC